MSQQVSTNQRTRELLTAPPPIQPWSAESEADRLMDELFSDIDLMLEGSSKLPTEPVKPEYVSLRSIIIPQLTMPPMPPAVIPPPDLVSQPTPEVTEITDIAPLVPKVDRGVSQSSSRFGRPFEKLLLAGGIGVLALTVILLLTHQQKLTWPWLLNFSASPSTQKGKISESDTQFISYMQRSLEVIDRKTEAKQKTPATGTTAPTNPQSVATAGNRPLPATQGTTVLERVYIPVYPPQTPWTPPVPPVAARPTIPAPSIAPRSIASPSIASPSRPAPSRRLPSPVPIPSAPASPQAVRPAATAAAPPQPAAPTVIPTVPAMPPAAPAATHTLMGLLELGDRSAALFEINGITQRFNVGEAIGASGWTLVSVANQEAVIRRNGEVRSIYVGQKF